MNITQLITPFIFIGFVCMGFAMAHPPGKAHVAAQILGFAAFAGAIFIRRVLVG